MPCEAELQRLRVLGVLVGSSWYIYWCPFATFVKFRSLILSSTSSLSVALSNYYHHPVVTADSSDHFSSFVLPSFSPSLLRYHFVHGK